MKNLKTHILRCIFTLYILFSGIYVASAASSITGDTQLLYTSSTSATSGDVGSGDFWLAANASFNNALTIEGGTYYAANWKDNCVRFQLGDVSSYTQMDVKIYYAAKSSYNIKLGIGTWFNSITKELGGANGTGNSNGLTTTISVTGSDLASYNQYVIYSDASSGSDVRFAGCVITFSSSATPKKAVTATLSINSGTNTLKVGDWKYANLVISGLDDGHTIATQNNSNLTYTSSDESVATIDNWSFVKAKSTGTVTLTATFDGDEYYAPFSATCDVTITDAPATNTLTPSTLVNSSTIALTTSAAVDGRRYFTANGTSTSSNGVLFLEADSPISVASNGYTLSASAATTEGSLRAYWHPEYAREIDAATFVAGCQPQEADGNTTSTNSGTCEITVDQVRATGYVAYTFIANSWSTYPVSDFQYFLIELEEDLSATGIIIAAEYANGLDDDWKIFTSGRFLYIPFKSNGQLKRIGIGGNTGQTTIKVKSCGFVNSVYQPANTTVSDIVVTSNKTMVQTNTINYNDAVYDPTSITYDNVYDAVAGADITTYSLGTETHDGKSYVQVPYDYVVKVVPTFTDASTSEELSPNFNCVGASFDTDAEGETIEAFNVGNNSTNKGVVTPLIPGYGDVAISGSLSGYNSTSQRTHIVIVKAVGIIRNPTGGLLSDVYSGTALGLTTKNSKDLDGKFKVFDAKNNDITEYGTFTYESTSLTVNGSTVSGTTVTTEAYIKIIWVPDAEHAPYYEAIHGTLYNIEVVDPTAGYHMDVDPTELNLVEHDTYDLSSLNITVTNNGTDVKSSGTITYSITTANQTYIEVTGSTLTAKLYDLEVGTRPVVTVTWTDKNDNSKTLSQDIKVSIKKRVALIVSPPSMTLTQGESQTFKAFNDINGNDIQDEGEADIDGVTPTFTATDFLSATADNKAAYVRVTNEEGVYTVTALYAAKDGSGDGTATVTAKYTGSSKYGPATGTIAVTVKDNTKMDYVGWRLKPGLSGTLTNPSTPTQHYIHWRFGAPDSDDGVYVMRYNKPNYSFKNEVTSLQSSIHNSFFPFDEFYETYLTDTKRTLSGSGTQIDAKGDAFLEYNGMVAGYGTELGGRYMTPISGTFVRVEAEYDGVVTVRLRHNGSIDTKDITTIKDGETVTGYKNIKQARRALFVIDENGVVMPRTTTNYDTLEKCDILNDSYRTALKSINGTYARISSKSEVSSPFTMVNRAYTKFFETGSLSNTIDGLTYTVGADLNVSFSMNAFHFCRNFIYDEYGDANATKFRDEIVGGAIQRLFYSDEESDVSYQAPTPAGASTITKTYFFSKYGYETLGATMLVISFPVKAGKTYFVAANKSKIGLCSIEFDPATSYSTTDVTLDENATASSGTNSWLLNTADGAHLDVTLNRTFVPYRWHPLILPFSVSETQLRSIFGENVSVIALDGSLRMMSSMNNYASRDGDFYDTTTLIEGAGRTGNDIPFNGSVIKDPAIKDGAVTFTHHWYQMIYANCPVFLWFDGDSNVKNPTFTNVTFQKYTRDKTDLNAAGELDTPAINNDYSVTFPYLVDRQIGDGATYDYVMRASYVKRTPSSEMYYVTNEGTGDATTARIYHAQAGKAPEMKGMRVWIEPSPGTRTAPLRYISMQQYTGEEIDLNQESGICDVIMDEPIESMIDDDNVYDMMGRIVGRGSLEGLVPGIYIHRGHKYHVR